MNKRNAGSVGQPRDNDPRSSYSLLDNEKGTWENFRVEYDIPSVQQRIVQLGMPVRQALRLADGW
jgi:diadenosine tetraphosphatase ApaH/serine/threonine PP2A family protein phosphatase